MTHDSLPPLTPEEGGLHGNIPNTPEARAWFQELGEKAQTATHDPLCPVMAGCFCEAPDELCCQCNLIDKVRADTVEQIWLASKERQAAKRGES